MPRVVTNEMLDALLIAQEEQLTAAFSTQAVLTKKQHALRELYQTQLDFILNMRTLSRLLTLSNPQGKVVDWSLPNVNIKLITTGTVLVIKYHNINLVPVKDSSESIPQYQNLLYKLFDQYHACDFLAPLAADNDDAAARQLQEMICSHRFGEYMQAIMSLGEYFQKHGQPVEIKNILLSFNKASYEEAAKEYRDEVRALTIMPIQQVPRFELLFKEIIKHCEAGSDFHGQMQKALAEILRAATLFNKVIGVHMADQEKREMLQILQETHSSGARQYCTLRAIAGVICNNPMQLSYADDAIQAMLAITYPQYFTFDDGSFTAPSGDYQSDIIQALGLDASRRLNSRSLKVDMLDSLYAKTNDSLWITLKALHVVYNTSGTANKIEALAELALLFAKLDMKAKPEDKYELVNKLKIRATALAVTDEEARAVVLQHFGEDTLLCQWLESRGTMPIKQELASKSPEPAPPALLSPPAHRAPVPPSVIMDQPATRTARSASAPPPASITTEPSAPRFPSSKFAASGTRPARSGSISPTAGKVAMKGLFSSRAGSDDQATSPPKYGIGVKDLRGVKLANTTSKLSSQLSQGDDMDGEHSSGAESSDSGNPIHRKLSNVQSNWRMTMTGLPLAEVRAALATVESKGHEEQEEIDWDSLVFPDMKEPAVLSSKTAAPAPVARAQLSPRSAAAVQVLPPVAVRSSQDPVPAVPKPSVEGAVGGSSAVKARMKMFEPSDNQTAKVVKPVLPGPSAR